MASEQTIEHILVSRGFLSEAQMLKVRNAMEQLGGTFGEIILTMDLLSVEEFHRVQQLAEALEREHEAEAAKLSGQRSGNDYQVALPKLPAAAPALPDLPPFSTDLSFEDPLDGLGIPMEPVSASGTESTAVGPPPSPEEFAPPVSPMAAGGLPKLPKAGGAMVDEKPVGGLPKLPSSSNKPPERLKKMMEALEDADFDESLAETMAPGVLAQTPASNTSPDTSAQLREQVATAEIAQDSQQDIPAPVFGLTDDGLCKVCDTPYKDRLPTLCTKCRTFLKTPPRNDRLIGKLLGKRFLLNGRLGAGGMGLVYHATDLETEEYVACKILPIQLSTDESTIQRFNLEAKVMLELNHPNIVRAIDFGFEEELGCYLAMELLVGQEFKDRLQTQKTLTPEEVIEVFGQLCDAMAYAHDTGVVHRDLKPSNVFLMESDKGPFGHVKVIDFGIARLTAEDMPRHTVTGTFLGTPQYMSPEQAAAKSDLDHRSDIYSLGVMLFEVLVGRLPFVGEHIAQVLMHQIYMQPPTLVELRPEQVFPELLQSFLDEVLAKEPSGRPATMPLFKKGLMRVLADAGEGEWQMAEVTADIDDPMVSEHLRKAANELLASCQQPPLHTELSPEQLFERLASALRSPSDEATASVGEVAVLMLSEEVEEEPSPLPPLPVVERAPETAAVVGQIKPVPASSVEAPKPKTTTPRLVPKKKKGTSKANDSIRAAEAAFIQSQKRKFLFMLVFAGLFFGLLVVALLVAK